MVATPPSPVSPTIITLIQAFSVVAIIVGAFWTLYRFRVLKEPERARAAFIREQHELKRVQRDLERVEYELEREPGLTLTVETQVLGAIDTLPTSVQVIVRLKNLGKASDVVDWSASGVSSARVVGFADSFPLFGTWSNSRMVTDLPWKGADIRPGEESAFSLLVPVPEPGVYCLEVFVALSPRSVEMSSASIRAAGMRVENTLEASTVLFVLVPKVVT